MATARHMLNTGNFAGRAVALALPAAPVALVAVLAGCTGSMDGTGGENVHDSVSGRVTAAVPTTATYGGEADADRAVAATGADGPMSSPSPESVTVRRLTDPGCCPMPFWSPDSQSVRFYYDPGGGDGEVGLYSVPVDGGTPTYVGGEPLGTQLGGRFTTQLDGDVVELTRVSDGRVWRIVTDGAMLTMSADGARAAWVEGLNDTVPGQQPPPSVNKVMDLETGDVQTVDLPDGYLLGDWTTDGAWILTLQDRESELPTLVRLDLLSEETTDLFDGARLRTGRTSPGRTWLAISRTFEQDQTANGLYLVSTDGQVEPRRLELSGGYYWRDDDRLLLVPQEPGAASMTLWQVDAATGEAVRLTDPETTPFRIAAGEWAVAPDGSHVAFRSSTDDAVWVMRLPD